MTSSRSFESIHFTVGYRVLKLLVLVCLVACAAVGVAQQRPDGDPELRAELTGLLQAGSADQAVRRAQQALQATPQDPALQHEFVTLHLALARTWVAERRFEDCLTALEAVLAVKPAQAEALALREEIRAARQRAGRGPAEVQRLLRLELFDAAHERIRETRALRPDLAQTLAGSEQAAWLGAADDHYLAGNFNEAFALYEHVLAADPQAPADVRSRWALSLALALAESDFTKPIDPDAVARLLTRSADMLSQIGQPSVHQILAGLLADKAGRLLEAGRIYAQALNETWQLPPTDQRGTAVRALRRKAMGRLRRLHEAAPTQRRRGAWLMALPQAWKHRQTARFDVYARNDLVAERVAEAAEFHFPGIAAWLGIPAAETWQPRCEIRVHATLADLQQAAGAAADARAVSRTRVQGQRILLRRLDLSQADPLLLSSTLPNELTHLLLSDAHRDAQLPLAIVEGLALQAEPPARRLLLRRLLSETAADADRLLATNRLPDHDQLQFRARADALTGLLLHRLGRQATAAAAGPGPRPFSRPHSQPAAPSHAIARLLAALRNGREPGWWRAFGWPDRRAMQSAWAAWHSARRDPPRMPLMILAGGPSTAPGQGDERTDNGG